VRAANNSRAWMSPALMPIVLRMVYQIAKQVKISIIGIGDVDKAEDLIGAVKDQNMQTDTPVAASVGAQSSTAAAELQQRLLTSV
jgi:hypothetical protein